jgi:hypothetical protein
LRRVERSTCHPEVRLLAADCLRQSRGQLSSRKPGLQSQLIGTLAGLGLLYARAGNQTPRQLNITSKGHDGDGDQQLD